MPPPGGATATSVTWRSVTPRASCRNASAWRGYCDPILLLFRPPAEFVEMPPPGGATATKKNCGWHRPGDLVEMPPPGGATATYHSTNCSSRPKGSKCLRLAGLLRHLRPARPQSESTRVEMPPPGGATATHLSVFSPHAFGSSKCLRLAGLLRPASVGASVSSADVEMPPPGGATSTLGWLRIRIRRLWVEMPPPGGATSTGFAFHRWSGGSGSKCLRLAGLLRHNRCHAVALARN